MPRAPLPIMSVTHNGVVSSTTSKGVTPSSSLLRAHAPNQFPPLEFVYPHLSPEVRAGCCEPLLVTGSSRRYLCKCFSGCLSHGSRRGCRVPLPVTSPASSAFPNSRRWVGFPRIAPQRDFMRRVFRDRRLTFRPPGLLTTQVSPTAAPPRPQGSCDFYTQANHASLPVRASGMLAV